VSALCSAGQWGRDHEDGHSRDGHSHLIPAMAGKGRCADRQAGTLGPRQVHALYCSVAGGPQPTRGGRRCQEPLECPTLATLADAGCGIFMVLRCINPPRHRIPQPGFRGTRARLWRAWISGHEARRTARPDQRGVQCRRPGHCRLRRGSRRDATLSTFRTR
jgi:hypothetical protein